MSNVVIIGGGIAGLAAAYRLQQAAAEAGRRLSLQLIESAPRLGGKVVSERADGFLVEGGPDSILPHKPWALELIRELGIDDRLLPSNDERAGSFVFHDGRLVPMPEGLPTLVPSRWGSFLRSPLLSWPAKLRFAAERWVPPRRAEGDESLADFVRRRFGAGTLDRLAEPVLAHIHVADIERMSLRATYPRLAELEARHGSLLRGVRIERARQRTAGPAQRPTAQRAGGPPEARPPLFWTLRGGMAELIEALAQRLEPGAKILGRRVTRILPSPGDPSPDTGPRYTVVLDDGRELIADAVVLATPAFAAADLTGELAPDLAATLRTIPYVSMATLSLGYRRSDAGSQGFHPLDGFGFFVPRREACRVLACTWASTKFDHRAPAGDALLRVFLGGAGSEDLLQLDDSELLRVVRQDLDKMMGLTAEPRLAKLYRWPRGYPQYEVGHLARVQRIEAALPPGVVVAGSALHGVGLPDCVRSGFAAARQILSRLGPGVG